MIDSFKKWLGDRYERVMNRALFDAITRFFADQSVTNSILGNEINIVEALKNLCLDPEFKDAIERTTKSKSATFGRINKWGEVLAACIGKHYDRTSCRII